MTILIRKNQEFTDLLEKNLMSEHEEKRRLDNTVHVSDYMYKEQALFKEISRNTLLRL
jgi:hypothetical protein